MTCHMVVKPCVYNECTDESVAIVASLLELRLFFK